MKDPVATGDRIYLYYVASALTAGAFIALLPNITALLIANLTASVLVTSRIIKYERRQQCASAFYRHRRIFISLAVFYSIHNIILTIIITFKLDSSTIDLSTTDLGSRFIGLVNNILREDHSYAFDRVGRANVWQVYQVVRASLFLNDTIFIAIIIASIPFSLTLSPNIFDYKRHDEIVIKDSSSKLGLWILTTTVLAVIVYFMWLQRFDDGGLINRYTVRQEDILVFIARPLLSIVFYGALGVLTYLTLGTISLLKTQR